jgi:hypothetical protein
MKSMWWREEAPPLFTTKTNDCKHSKEEKIGKKGKNLFAFKNTSEAWIENTKAIHLHLQQKGRGTCEGEKHPNNKVIELMSKRITIGSWTRTYE